MLCVILLAFSLISEAQIIKEDDKVSMPLNVYRQIRIQVLRADTIVKQCDRLRTISQDRINTKDSIIAIQDQKLAIKDTMIAEKNRTIKLLADLPKEPKPSKLVLPLIIVSVAEFFLLILAIR